MVIMDQHAIKPSDLQSLIEETMHTALKEEQFQVYYQPKHDTQTGKLIGAEALIRWIHPELGFMSPGAFIPVFERTGFIAEADAYVWGKTCQNLRRWMDKGIPVVPISLNSSRIEFSDDQLYLSRRIEMTRQCNVPAQLMHIEVTESMFGKDMNEVQQILEECRDYGFMIELDDFGIGYSTLQTLGELPLDVVKLDMSFVQQIDDPKKQRIMTGCVNLLKNMKFRIVAEGVETEHQYQRVKELEIDAVQGYYYSRPLPAQEFEEYLMSVPVMTHEEGVARHVVRQEDVASYGDIDQCQFLLSHLMTGLLNMWVSSFVIDIRSGRSYEMSDNSSFHQLVTESSMSAEIMDEYVQKSLKSQYQAPYRAFFDFSTMEARFKEAPTLSLDFEDHHNGWMRSTIMPAGYDADGHLTHILLAVEIISSEKHEQTQKRRISEEDPLTGLHNRVGGTLVINQLLLQRTPFELMLIDIDYFKLINETYGHQAGDDVLIAMANTLRSDFPEADAVRLGGDEFLLVLKGEQDRPVLTERLQAFFQHFSCVSIEGIDQQASLSASVGGVYYDGKDFQTFDKLYHMADHCLYESQQLVGCSYVADGYCMPDISRVFVELRPGENNSNQQCHFRQLKEYFARPDVPATSYDILFDLSWKSFLRLDPFMTEKIVRDILLPYYKNEHARNVKHFGRLARLCLQLGNSLYNIYMMGDESALPKAMDMFRESIATAEKLPAQSPEYACKAFGTAMLLGHPDLRSAYVPKGQEAMRLYMGLRDMILKGGGRVRQSASDTHFRVVMQAAICYPVLRTRELQMLDTLTPEEQQELLDLLSFIRLHMTDKGGYDLLKAINAPETSLSLALPAALGTLSDREAFAKMRDIYLSFNDDFYEHLSTNMGMITQVMRVCLFYIKRIDFSEEEKERYALECFAVIVRTLHTNNETSVHYEFNRLTDLVISDPLLRKYLTPDEKLHFLTEDVGATMPYTSTHAITMARYAKIIAQCIIYENPALMLGLFGYQTPDEVQEHEEEILDFLHTACLLHDLGKNRMREIVHNVYRKIDEHELAVVRQHPEYSARMLSFDPSLMQYRDVVIGHHKWYNGQGGYPAGFDNTLSPVRILIDIASVADSLEAATSRVGRNYREPKTFGQIMDELRHLSGVRYNRDVVYAIFCSHETYMELEEMIDK